MKNSQLKKETKQNCVKLDAFSFFHTLSILHWLNQLTSYLFFRNDDLNLYSVFKTNCVTSIAPVTLTRLTLQRLNMKKHRVLLFESPSQSSLNQILKTVMIDIAWSDIFCSKSIMLIPGCRSWLILVILNFTTRFVWIRESFFRLTCTYALYVDSL